MHTRTRVLMVALAFYPAYSGAGTQAWRLCQKLIQKGVGVKVLAQNTDKNMEGETVGGVPVWRLPERGNGRRGAVAFAIRMFRFLIKNRRSYGIVHVHGAYWYAQVVILIGKILRKRVIVKMSLLGDDDPLSIKHKQFLGQLGYRTLALADIIISTSRELSDSYARSGLPADKLVEIPNGVDSQQFHPTSSKEKQQIRQTLGLPADNIIVAFVGVICQRKGIDILIDSWKHVTCQYPSAKLVLAGPENTDPQGHFSENLHEKIDALKLTEGIIFTGPVNNINQYLQSSDIFAFPSRREGMPNAVLEAMACGLPCVAMESSCVSDIITNDVNGLIFASENGHQLTQHISRLIDDPDLRRRLGNRARKTVINKFSFEIVSNLYLELYQELLSLKS